MGNTTMEHEIESARAAIERDISYFSGWDNEYHRIAAQSKLAGFSECYGIMKKEVDRLRGQTGERD